MNAHAHMETHTPGQVPSQQPPPQADRLGGKTALSPSSIQRCACPSSPKCTLGNMEICLGIVCAFQIIVVLSKAWLCFSNRCCAFQIVAVLKSPCGPIFTSKPLDEHYKGKYKWYAIATHFTHFYTF